MRVDRLTNQPIKRVMEGRRAGDPPTLVSANQRILERSIGTAI